jgi:hypothetical protein
MELSVTIVPPKHALSCEQAHSTSTIGKMTRQLSTGSRPAFQRQRYAIIVNTHFRVVLTVTTSLVCRTAHGLD